MSPEEAKQTRENCNLSRQEFARKIGATERSVYRWECGQATPSPVFIKAIEELVMV